MNSYKLHSLFGVDFPIIQSPMAGVQDSSLAVAVSEAGGLGSLPCGMLSIDEIVKEVSLIKKSTDKPFNLNFFCHTVNRYDEVAHSKWQALLNPFFDEFGSMYDETNKLASRTPFNHDIADAIEGFSPDVVSFHFGLPDKILLERVKSWGGKVISTATTIEEAKWLESKGVDGIIAQGIEAGGHRGMFLTGDISTQMGLFSLVPQVVNQVKVPVIAAGGISDRLGVKAALTLGAVAVQIGTAYLLCSELKTTQLHRFALKSTQNQYTALTNVFTGKPARGIVNRIMKDLGYINASVPEFPHASLEMTQLRSLAEKQGLSDFSPLWCGQNTVGCKEVSAYELTKSLVED